MNWGYDRIAGALANLGFEVSDQTVGNVLRRHALPPVPERKRTTTWPAFIRAHLALLAGTDFFTVEVLTLRGAISSHGGVGEFDILALVLMSLPSEAADVHHTYP